MPCTPTATNASRTSSSLNGLMMAMTSFMTLSCTAVPRDARMHEAAWSSLLASRHTISALWPKIKPIRLSVGDFAGSGQREAWRANQPGNAFAASCTDPAFPQQPLLSHRSNQRPVAREDKTTREAARAREVGTVLTIEQPVVSAKRSMKPQRMIEARGHDGLFEHRTAVRDQRRIEQHHVRSVGKHALVDGRLVRERASSTDPDVEATAVYFFPEIPIEVDRSQLDRALPLIIAADRIGQ